MKSQIIKTEDLSRTFRNNGSVTTVIRGLDTSIYKGEFTVIMGNSGSGKSTLLYLLCGLDKATSGSVWINDIPVHGLSEKDLALLRRNNVGFVFQDNNLVPSLTIKENILVAGYLVNKDKKLLNRRADSLLEDLDILPLAGRMPSQVSGGESQRCSIARALINNPVVLLADEPTGSLNSEASEKVLDCLVRLHRYGQSIIMVTHDIKSASRGERVLFFRDGRIIDELRFDQNDVVSAKEDRLLHWLKERGW
jgi:putative ABC transport system ATP-binding protein